MYCSLDLPATFGGSDPGDIMWTPDYSTHFLLNGPTDYRITIITPGARLTFSLRAYRL